MESKELRNLSAWRWPFAILVVVILTLYMRYVPYVRKQRGVQETRITQDIADTQRAPLIRAEAMWREYAEKAKIRGDIGMVTYYNQQAEMVRNLYSN